MTLSRLCAIALTIAAMVLIVLAWRHMNLLRGTVLQDLRFVSFTVVAFAVLSIANRIATIIEARLEQKAD